eukprot:c21307_g1_i1.p1 GENE.c21307_g1_i1~~c21307_g1_i1.p1  ORF type:complete len:784 (-),score=300.44 c21307_g1_i1:137-2488(-)
MRREILFVLAVTFVVVFGLPKTTKDIIEEQLLAAASQSTTGPTVYNVGVGRADITGPIGSKLMGYDIPDVSNTIHTRLYARAFFFEERADSTASMTYVVIDRWIATDTLIQLVMNRLNGEIEGTVFTRKNLCITATHTHSGTSLYSEAGIVQLSAANTIQTDSDVVLINGVVAAIKAAVTSKKPGVLFHKSFVYDNVARIGIQRAPQAFMNNIFESGSQFPGKDTGFDSTISMLKILTKPDGSEVLTPLGLISWSNVQTTNMQRRTGTISGDNKGVASLLFERKMAATAGFVSAFTTSSMGDASPNIAGPKCTNGNMTDNACDFFATTDSVTKKITWTEATVCDGNYQNCKSKGPHGNDYLSATEIGYRLMNASWTEFNPTVTTTSGHSSWTAVSGSLKSAVYYRNLVSANPACGPALGITYLAGNIDGTTLDTTLIKIYPTQNLSAPDPFLSWAGEQIVSRYETTVSDCQYPKYIIGGENIMSNGDTFPPITSAQVFFFGDNLVSLHVPFSVTQYAGWKLAQSVKAITNQANVIISGPANGYKGYITTEQEYAIQRFEGAATIFGSKTLSKYTDLVNTVVSCGKTGCPEPLTASGPAGSNCPESTGNCYPFVDLTYPTKLNALTTLLLDMIGELNNDAPTPPPFITTNPASVYVYTANSLNHFPGIGLYLQARASGIFNNNIMSKMIMQVHGTNDQGSNSKFLFTEKDPETVVRFQYSATSVIATLYVYYGREFDFATHKRCRITHTSYNVNAETAYPAVTLVPVTTPSLTPSPSPSPTKSK